MLVFMLDVTLVYLTKLGFTGISGLMTGRHLILYLSIYFSFFKTMCTLLVVLPSSVRCRVIFLGSLTTTLLLLVLLDSTGRIAGSHARLCSTLGVAHTPL